MLLEVLVLVVGLLVAVGLIVLLERKLDEAYAVPKAEAKPAPAAAPKAAAKAAAKPAPAAPKAPVVESGIPAEVVAAIAAAVVSLEGAVAVRSIRKAPAGGSRRGVWGDAGVLANTTPFMA